HVNYAVFVVVTHALRLFVVVHSLAPLSTLFPYTTLFRSAHPARGTAPRRRPAVAGRGARLPHPLAARPPPRGLRRPVPRLPQSPDRKSTRLNSSHVKISYAVFCLKKKNSGGKKVKGPVHH